MTRNEVPEKIVENFAKHDWQLTAVELEKPLKFEHFADVYNFVEKEQAFWNAQNKRAVGSIKSHWSNIFSYLTSAIRNAAQGDYNQFLNHAASSLKTNTWPNIVSDTLIAKKILGLPDGLPEQRVQAFLLGAIAGFPQPQNFRLDQPQVFAGMVEGLAFREPGVLSELLNVANADLEKNYQERLKETENLRQTYSTLEKSLQDTFAENKQAVEAWRAEKLSALDTDLKAVRQRYHDLEQLYAEKLKLEAPAQYWKKRATRMRRAGFGWLIASVVFFIGIGWVLWHNFIASSTFIDVKDLNTQVTAAAAGKDAILTYFSSVKNIRSLVGFSVLASLYFFLLRMLIKLTISSFHLSLDAAEREQLTYVYLSLIDRSQKDSKDVIVGEDRKIILQSLFSRADTGLLAGDSAPTMPGADIINTVRGGGKG